MKEARQDPGLPFFAAEAQGLLTVSELNEIVKGTLERELDAFWVVGEISNFRVPPSGHLYFTLKDDKSQIAAVMFRRRGLILTFQPENGMEVMCFGRVSLYSPRGDLQIYVETMEPRGQGALYVAFEQLKKRLGEEGLFAPERSEEHTSELQSQFHLVCRLLLEKNKTNMRYPPPPQSFIKTRIFVTNEKH